MYHVLCRSVCRPRMRSVGRGRGLGRMGGGTPSLPTRHAKLCRYITTCVVVERLRVVASLSSPPRRGEVGRHACTDIPKTQKKRRRLRRKENEQNKTKEQHPKEIVKKKNKKPPPTAQRGAPGGRDTASTEYLHRPQNLFS